MRTWVIRSEMLGNTGRDEKQAMGKGSWGVVSAGLELEMEWRMGSEGIDGKEDRAMGRRGGWREREIRVK